MNTPLQTQETTGENALSLLLVDDDVELCAMLCEYLTPEGFAVTSVHRGDQALEITEHEQPDIIVLDVMLPGINGLEVLKALRRKSATPVLMLTLELGADDYLAKPFNTRELVARLRAILRRADGSLHDDGERKTLRLGVLELDPASQCLNYADRQLRLTGAEFAILALLMQSPGEAVARDLLCQRALGRKLLPYDRSVDTHISNLRGKLRAFCGDAVVLRSTRGVGYLIAQGAEPQ